MHSSQSDIRATARINKDWAIRLGLIAALFIAGGSWYLYDGLVTYPNQTAKFDLVYEMVDTNGDGEPEPVRHDDWKSRLEEAGYDSEIDPKKLNRKSAWDIRTQLIIAGICYPIGLLALFWLVANKFRPLYADGEGVRFGGKRMAYDAVEEIDKSRWDSKGIAVLIDRQGGKLTLDDWKFKGAADVLEEVEKQTGGQASAGSSEATDQGGDEGDAAAKPDDAEQPV